MASDSKKVSSNGKADTKIVPLGDRVLIKPLTQEEVSKKTTSGIIIPETIDKEKPEQGKVVAVGEGRYEEGKLIPVKVKIGDRVLFSKYGYDDVKVDDEEFYILKEENILAIIK
jgi:chaperonin GroES